MQINRNINMNTEAESHVLAVFGSRSLTDNRVRELLIAEIEKHRITRITTAGEPHGACEVARKLARELAMPLVAHYLNFKFQAGAFERRSLVTLHECDRAVFVWDGESQGTANEIELAKKKNVLFTLHTLEPVRAGLFGTEDDWNIDIESILNKT